jgi:hypothetical protein
MSGEDGFLRRWSRLKRSSPAPEAPVAEDLPEEVPPPVETIPVEEIGPWLKRRVPQAWRVLALRRLWVSDAAIAGFIGPADYQFDWEALGGSPGWGPLRAVDDIADLLTRAIGAHRPPPDAVPDDVVVADQTPPKAQSANLVDAAEPSDSATESVETGEREAVTRRRRGGAATPV